ncbi:MAG: Polyribonucleotide nucleotidyltransferase, polyribonucleotide nucleotidyltransferase [Candidatus Peregrinibacteria bacterium GW2011_GWC2_39_14]|nr:MAG: Polyribonucleotide nucleotidyltransferase [Candidatus Peregrinibacteria bacterium GW2011_GWA2_38_36]KKR05010.1 MAG: Polyribonucleotide nucleotidyltransferase, polyribonucleotide nucleotidyltransferase [Candidatus Peregrinibacteria bacterium GW2011_GWC2_39_14]
MESKFVEHNLAGRILKFDAGKFFTQASGTVTVSLGDTVILSTTIINDEAKENADFFPMVVDYEERYYAAGKIKGSRFIKREGRPSDNAILTSRLIDRPLRPLFPKGMVNDVQVIATVLSADLEVDPGIVAINGCSAALLLAGAPFAGPLAAVKIGYIVDSEGKEQLVVNPTYEQCRKGKLDLTVAGTPDAITMVEAAASEVSEDVMLKALELAHKHIKEICAVQLEFAKLFNPTLKTAAIMPENEEAKKAFAAYVTDDMVESVRGQTKHEFKDNYKKILKSAVEKYKADIEAEKFSKKHLDMLLNEAVEDKMRKRILEKEERLDGRKLDEIRPLSCEVGVLPRTHGSALFRRGETQVLDITTLGAPGDAQIIETMDQDEEKRYMHHYSFPSYAVGEIKPSRGPNRREIGHGNLAERALMALIPDKEKFPYTIWTVSETLSCNGSSSMASVCASSLSLMDAGVPIPRHVAGIAMGLITDGKSNYKILTDIQGMEDFCGDMDFKVAGSREGITALQMDIKVKGITIEIMKTALDRAKIARMQILDVMEKALPQTRPELSKYAPLITTVKVPVEQIKDVIGKGGETIQKITKECGVTIDIEEDGLTFITAPDQEKGKKALEWVKRIIYIPKVGDVFEGRVTRIMEFGAFVELVPGKEGLVHISQLSEKRVNRVEEVVKLGDTLKVKLMEIDDMGRYNLSHKATLK